ncbi:MULTISPECIES: FtsH protease activity modulator HflK [Nitrosomonas]|uniref:Protein HflK n=1 Tax=Nitrosomonas communis TaxID=44574 RepID=A0A0F7KHP6_9PROT|nr:MULTISPECIES: FtsH protease activity modulator HflK [Nitrosomonas]AKH38663.1 membrane protein [Nitrosomonas communis]TYP89358.1 membrane protease subunit HflK [Nitrosomonas communis]UVS60733.1 FtsH protease activity modulator HflK [Nitrosomonas sp. PLL12]
MNDLKSILGRTLNALPISPLLGMLGIMLLVVALTSAFYTIPAESEGIVLRFGKYIEKVPSGLHVKLPLEIDTVISVPTQRQQKLEFGFATPGYTNPDQAGDEPELEKSMVTGDLNSALVEWIVQYRITDPEKYLFDVRDPGLTLRDISEAVMREVVGDRTVDEIITIGRQEIEETALARIRLLAEHYQLGMTINQVQSKNVNPPEPVQPSFNEVNRAQQDRENVINLANGEYNKAVPRARGEADQKIRAADGYRFKRINEAEGDVAAFNQLLEQYLKAPEVTRTRIYLETLGEVLPQARQQIIVDDTVQQILPMLPFPTNPVEMPQ